MSPLYRRPCPLLSHVTLTESRMGEKNSDDIIREDSPGRARSASQVAEMASPARQTIVLAEPAAAENSADTLTREFFAAVCQTADIPGTTLSFSSGVSWFGRAFPRISEKLYLKKHSSSEELAFIKAPKLNPECKSALKNRAIGKRDEYCCINQDQVGFALLAFGEALSDLLRRETQRSLIVEVCAAVGKLNNGVKNIADLYYRRPLSRRAHIKPDFNTLAKTTTDTVSADNLLISNSFSKQIKNSLEGKSSKDIVNASLTLSKETQQRIKYPRAAVASRHTATGPAPEGVRIKSVSIPPGKREKLTRLTLNVSPSLFSAFCRRNRLTPVGEKNFLRGSGAETTAS
ncbi:uncharacterized protein [Temnothorax nylanderi]|uniref:uncharacterized protein n=1 Tax=Temnothorax nylanderi TaxID=102681 RepID=UPI003A8B4704